MNDRFEIRSVWPTNQERQSITDWRSCFSAGDGLRPSNPRRFAAAPRGMPIPLRFIGCLPVVASLLSPGTRLTAPAALVWNYPQPLLKVRNLNGFVLLRVMRIFRPINRKINS